MRLQVVAVGVALAAGACGRFGFGGDDGGDVDAPVTADAPAGIDAPIDATPAIPGLLARYSMDDDPSDGVITDDSGAGLDAVCVAGFNCPEQVAGHSGNALRFDGTTDEVVRIVAPALFTDGQAFTISAWVFLDDGAFDQVALARPVNSGSRDSWAFVAWQNGPTCFETTLAGDISEDVCAGPALPANAWLHVAGVTTATSKELWINGVRAAQTTGASQIDFDDHDIVIGMDENGGMPAYRWHGAVDEVQLYGRGLTDEEIGTLAAQ